MKGLKLSLVVMAAALLTIGLTGVSEAFHSGGVADCEGCHTMHNSLNGAKMIVNAKSIGVANENLLQGSDQSSTCLNCHAKSAADAGSYHIMTYPLPAAGVPPANYTPGGDFAWLAKDYTWIPRGTTPENSEGYKHGHNVVAADFGLVADVRYPGGTAPGGTYNAAKLNCISCHDPHGRYRVTDSTAGTFWWPGLGGAGKPIKSSGSYGVDATAAYAVGAYRLLAGKNYAPASYVGASAFTQDPLFAAVNSSYNKPMNNYYGIRVAYGKGSSDWCANCHNAMHSTLSTVPGSLVHPTGENLGGTIAANYNAYVKSGNLSGVVGNAFTSLVPFENNLVTNSALYVFTGKTDGPTGSDRVSCFTCHKAHASAFDSIRRWSDGNEFLTVGNDDGTARYADPAVSAEAKVAQGRSLAEQKAAYEGRDATVWAAGYQRSLCNKCHVKD
jgi:hypothetical protein